MATENPLIGMIVGWPTIDEKSRGFPQWVGCGRIVAVLGDRLALVEALELEHDEPPHHIIVQLDGYDLKFFADLAGYQRWLAYWRDDGTVLSWSPTKGRA